MIKNFAVIAPTLRDFWHFVHSNNIPMVRSKFSNIAVEDKKGNIYFFCSYSHGAERLRGLRNIELIWAGRYQIKRPEKAEEFEIVAKMSRL